MLTQHGRILVVVYRVMGYQVASWLQEVLVNESTKAPCIVASRLRQVVESLVETNRVRRSCYASSVSPPLS